MPSVVRYSTDMTCASAPSRLSCLLAPANGPRRHSQPPRIDAAISIWDTRDRRSPHELTALSGALVASGVRYAVCGGVDCKTWHDAVDLAFIQLDLHGEEYDSRFVMTSWHTDEPVDDVAFFFVLNTNFDTHDFTQFLVLQLGADRMTEHQLRESVRKHAMMAADEEPRDDSSRRAV
jgi:hypothetical protein